MSFYSNKFLGDSSGFTNNGTLDLNVNSVQIQNLSPNELVGTDQNRNLISVPYKSECFINLSDIDNNSYENGGNGIFRFNTVNRQNIQFTPATNTINIIQNGSYLVQYRVQASYFGARTDLAVYVSINGANFSPFDITRSASSGSNGSYSPAGITAILNLNAGDRLSLNYFQATAFLISSISMTAVLLSSTSSGGSNPTTEQLQEEIERRI
jgi:hypothetical protein